MRRGVAMGVEEEVRAGFGPKKPRNENEGAPLGRAARLYWLALEPTGGWLIGRISRVRGLNHDAACDVVATGKEWAKQGGMAWRVRTGHGRHASESEERLETFKQKLRDIKNKADREAAAGRAGVKQQRQQAVRPKDSQPRPAESQELGSSAMDD